jgi:putative oxidoreductase
VFLRSLPEPARDVLVLAARLTVAFVMLAHVWDTFGVKGFTSTSGQFENFGIPLAIAATAFTLVAELVGSILLAIGLFVPYASALMTFVMLGAVFFVHGEHGVFVRDNGWELVGLIAAVCVAIAANGPGRLSLDHVIFDRIKKPAAPEPVDVSSDPAGVPIAPAPQAFRPVVEGAAPVARWDDEPRWAPQAAWQDRPTPAPRFAHEQQRPASLWDEGAPAQQGGPSQVANAYARAHAARTARGEAPVWTEPGEARPTYAGYADPHTGSFGAVER